MRVLLVHQAFVGEGQAGGTRHLEMARHLVKRGHEFVVIASSVSYLTGAHSPDWDGEKGIAVKRGWTLQSDSSNILIRILVFGSFTLSSFVASLFQKNIDVVWGTSPPLLQSVSAYVVARLRRKPFLLEVRDLWPDFAVELGILRNPFLIRASRWVEKYLYRHADLVVVNSPGFVDHVASLSGGRTVHVVPNGVDVGMFDVADRRDVVRRENGWEKKFVVLYAGAQGFANHLEVLLEAAHALRDAEDIEFVFVGDGRERARLEAKSRESGLGNVSFLGPKPKAEIPELLGGADVCVAILRDVPIFTTTYPNKVFDYMAAGKPVVLAIDGVVRDVVEAAAAGTFVTPGDPMKLAEAIAAYAASPELCRRQGENGRAYVRKHFARETTAQEMERCLEAALDARR